MTLGVFQYRFICFCIFLCLQLPNDRGCEEVPDGAHLFFRKTKRDIIVIDRHGVGKIFYFLVNLKLAVDLAFGVVRLRFPKCCVPQIIQLRKYFRQYVDEWGEVPGVCYMMSNLDTFASKINLM